MLRQKSLERANLGGWAFLVTLVCRATLASINVDMAKFVGLFITLLITLFAKVLVVLHHILIVISGLTFCRMVPNCLFILYMMLLYTINDLTWRYALHRNTNCHLPTHHRWRPLTVKPELSYVWLHLDVFSNPGLMRNAYRGVVCTSIYFAFSSRA